MTTGYLVYSDSDNKQPWIAALGALARDDEESETLMMTKGALWARGDEEMDVFPTR
ncbi:MAG: hypothetical protein ACK5O7_06540 [Holosporales bacterium]